MYLYTLAAYLKLTLAELIYCIRVFSYFFCNLKKKKILFIYLLISVSIYKHR